MSLGLHDCACIIIIMCVGTSMLSSFTAAHAVNIQICYVHVGAFSMVKLAMKCKNYNLYTVINSIFINNIYRFLPKLCLS